MDRVGSHYGQAESQREKSSWFKNRETRDLICDASRALFNSQVQLFPLLSSQVLVHCLFTPINPFFFLFLGSLLAYSRFCLLHHDSDNDSNDAQFNFFVWTASYKPSRVGALNYSELHLFLDTTSSFYTCIHELPHGTEIPQSSWYVSVLVVVQTSKLNKYLTRIFQALN